jgi:hypothetical protein
VLVPCVGQCFNAVRSPEDVGMNAREWKEQDGRQ